jgi:uncharacterized membrane protein YfcA
MAPPCPARMTVAGERPAAISPPLLRGPPVTFDASLLTAALADLRWSALAVAALSGLVRGFSGFGSALIYMPLVAAIYEPRIAAVTLLLIDFFASAPFALRELRNCTWREVLPIFLAAAVAIPFGTLALKFADPVVLRWFISLLVLSLLAALLSGWRYHRRPRLPVTIGVGLFSGFSGGAVQVAGPAVIMYWLGTSTNSAATIRANMMVYFLLTGATLCVAYLQQGLIGADDVALSLLLGVPFVLAMAVGAYVFRGASDLLYRRLAYVVIAVAAVISLPLLDELLR